MMPVPVQTTDPPGTGFARSSYSTNVSIFRWSFDVFTEPRKMVRSQRWMVHVISSAYGLVNSSAVTITGPRAQQPVYTFDWGR